jgi:hypothetical protein
MRISIHDMGGNDARMCRVDLDEITESALYTVRVMAPHGTGVYDQTTQFTGTSYSTPNFLLPTKRSNGQPISNLNIDVTVFGANTVRRAASAWMLQGVDMFHQTQVDAAVAAAVAAANNLQPLINAGLILQPQRRVGNYTIKDFTVLNAIYRAGSPTNFIKKDLDFINVQLLSIRQAVQKMYQVAVAKENDLNATAIFRTRQDKRKEYAANIDDSFTEFLLESVRVMNYAVDEVRFNQKFNLPSPTLVRDLDVLP